MKRNKGAHGKYGSRRDQHNSVNSVSSKSDPARKSRSNSKDLVKPKELIEMQGDSENSETNDILFSSITEASKRNDRMSPELNSNENPKFKEACEKIKMNIQKHIGDGMQYGSSSSSEDELDDHGIIEKTFFNYDVGGSGLSKTREFLQESLTSGGVVCLICIESVRRNDPVWSCGNCYCILHVPCIQKWAKDSMFHQSSNAERGDRKNVEAKWCCPKCRHEYMAHQTPTKYFCFCGKVEDPTFDPWTIPHSCGLTCEKMLKPECGHQCLLLCHPGPCPPCPKTVFVSCFCGRNKPVAKRCSTKQWSCGRPCGKLLSCKEHHCTDPCHGGLCNPCILQSQQSCLCGAEKTLRPCDNRVWRCEKQCSKPLGCGHHACELICHEGSCPPCPRSGLRPCPCGKSILDLPCTEQIPPCGDTCGKLLRCGIHTCVQRCHLGDCGDCLQMRVMKCRCGQRVKSVPCRKELLCDIKCKNKRDCGKHNCNRKCCIGDCPRCEAPCLRTLNCGSHKCQSRCHAGPCFPCRETVEIKCNCGQTKMTVPCGRRSSAVPPQCFADCKLPADCHHEERHKHRCHYGDCPPCRKICGKVHPCGHACPAKCHSAVLTKVEVIKKREGPWDLANAYKMQLVEKPCPPCVVPQQLSCLGGHVIYDFPCHEAKPWSCGRPCGRQLACSNHLCKLQCHNLDGDAHSTQQTKHCEPCERLCEKKRPKGCTHSCLKPCHPEECDPCHETMKVRCHCQINTLIKSCAEWCAADERKKDEMLCCQNPCYKQLSCGHKCPLTCHKGKCPDRSICKKKITIRCLCKRLKKEVPCVSKIEKLDCNQECLANQEKTRAEQAALREIAMREEKDKQERELEEFRRKMEGKKRKIRKQKESVEETSWLHWEWSDVLIITLVCVLALAFFLTFMVTQFPYLPQW